MTQARTYLHVRHRAEEGTICVYCGISTVHCIANAYRRHRDTVKTVDGEPSGLYMTWGYPDIDYTDAAVGAELRISSESDHFLKKKSAQTQARYS